MDSDNTGLSRSYRIMHSVLPRTIPRFIHAYQGKIWDSHLGEGNRRILCGCMSFRHARVVSVTLQQLAAIRPFPRQTAAHRQAMGHRG